MASEPVEIADLMERIISGDPWHGPSVKKVLDGVTADAATRRPLANAHSIWELVIHMTGWTREVTARLRGRAAQEPEAGDWPAIGDPTDARWRDAQSALFVAHRELAETIRQLDPAMLWRPVLDFRDNALGTGLTHYVTLHGLLHHTLYHAGQVAILRRALE
jgi:DinB family protein